MLILIAIATFISTLLGGLTALKNQKHLHKILGYTAGVILGVVAFDIVPEIFKLTNAHSIDPLKPMIALVAAFLIFHIAEKNILIHQSHEHDYEKHKHPQVGTLAASALVGHSFLDGVGIGLGFQVSNAVGLVVAIAVIAHDFSDGVNTVALMLNNNNSKKRSLQLLLLDALAPILGIASTMLFSFEESALVLYLGFFAGFLLYICASDILPEAHRDKPSRSTMLLTILGTVFIYVIVRLAG